MKTNIYNQKSDINILGSRILLLIIIFLFQKESIIHFYEYLNFISIVRSINVIQIVE
jgi:hypothetical protein